MRCGLFHENREKKEDSSKISNAYAVSVPRNQNPVPSAVEDVTENIQHLSVTCDNKRIPEINFVDLVVSESRPTCVIQDNDKGEKVTEEKEENEEKEVEQETEDETEEEEDDNDDDDEEDDEGNDNLIERGPMKSHVFIPPRNRPYSTITAQSWLGDINESELLDYNKSVEEILSDQERQNATKEIDQRCCTIGNNEIESQVCDSKDELVSLSAIDVNDPTGNLLLENVLSGNFQAAQNSSDNKNRETSSLAYPPASTVCTDSLQPITGQQNYNQSPLDSSSLTNDDSYREQQQLLLTSKTLEVTFDPPVNTHVPNLRLAPSTYRATLMSSCSSSSSSSSSNQSYGDASSPYAYPTPFTPPIDEQFNQDFEKFSILKQPDITESTEETAIDNINDLELWSKVLEDLVNGFEDGNSSVTEINYQQTNTHRTNASLFGETNPEEIGIDCFPRPSDVSCPDFNSLLNSTLNTPSSTTIADTNFNTFETIKATNTTDNSNIPKMVASFESRHRRQRRCDKNTTPWPSLNLPSVTASDRLKEQVNPIEVEKAMMNLLKRPVEELAKQDEDGDTMLMCLIGNPEEFARKKAYLAPLVERLSTMKGALAMTNDRGEDALYLAAMNCPQFPYVAGYLAAAMLQKNIDISQRLYRTRGNSLIHSVAAQGDSHIEVLAELLALRTNQGNAVFDLSKRNYDGKTVLHVAIESHQQLFGGKSSLASVKMLQKYGADPRTKETERGDTALHIAASRVCDPVLVKVLLDACGSELVNAINYNHDTPLHLAVSVSNNVPLKRQTEVCWLLIHAGGNTNLPNRQGKIPLDLIPQDRKEALRKIFYGRS